MLDTGIVFVVLSLRAVEEMVTLEQMVRKVAKMMEISVPEMKEVVVMTVWAMMIALFCALAVKHVPEPFSDALFPTFPLYFHGHLFQPHSNHSSSSS